MGGPSKHRDSLGPPRFEAPPRRGTLDKAAGAPGPSVTSGYHPWEDDELNLDDEADVSGFSVATAVGLGACASGISLALAPAERLRGEKARSLLRMLLRTQKTSEDSVSFPSTGIHNLVPCGDVVGLLAIIVKQCKDFTPKLCPWHPLEFGSRTSKKYQNRFCECCGRSNDFPDCTETSLDSPPVKIHKKVPKQKNDPRNRISLELVGFEGPKEFPRLFGSVTMHLYDIIQKQSFTEICAMRIRNMSAWWINKSDGTCRSITFGDPNWVFCTAEVEFMFCYGCLGYGYSHQLKLPGADPAQSVAYSMFLRVPPPENRKDTVTNVIKPQLMDYPACLSSDLNVTVGNIELDPPAEMTDHYLSLQRALKEPPRERLQRLKKEYRSLSTWREKAEYLDQLILKRGPKTKPSQPKMSRFREIVEKFHVPRFASTPSQGVSLDEEKIVTILLDETPPDERQPIMFAAPKPICEETESEGEMAMATGLVKPTETAQQIPVLAVTSSTTSSRSSEEGDVLEDKVTTGKGGSETSLSSSETRDVESPAFTGPEIQEKLPDIVKKTVTLEYLPEPTQSKESFPRSGFPQLVPDEFVTPKISDSVVKSEQLWRWKDSGFQEAVFSGNKFEPFLRRVCKVSPPAPRKGNTHEYRYLEEAYFSDDAKEEEDQDPPYGFPSTKADSGQDTKSTRSGEQLSILRLIEKKMSLEEGHKIATEEEEPKLRSISPKFLGDKMSDAEVDQAHIYFKGFLEDFLVDKLVKVSALGSVLSKNIENLVAERLSETQLFQELEDSLKEKQLPEEKRSIPREKFSKPDMQKLKEIVSQNLQTRLVRKFCQQGIIPDLKVAEKDEFSLPSAADLLKRKEPEIITIKSLSDSQLEDITATEPDVKGTELATSELEDNKEALCPLKTTLRKESSLEIIRVKLPFSTETDSSKQRLSNFDILLENVLKTEITSLKSFLNKKFQDHLKDKLLEIGVTPKDLKIVCRRLSFPQKEKHKMTPKELLQEDHVFSEEELAKERLVLSKSIQNLLEILSEKEMANLRSAMNKKIQSCVAKRLSEIEVITEKELQEILKHFFPIVAKEVYLREVKESDLSKKGQTIPPLTQNLHDRFSEEELQNLKTLLGRLLQEDHREKLSDLEVKGLTSVLKKNVEDLPIRSSSGTEMNKGVEIKDKSCNLASTNAEEDLKTNDVVVLDRGKEHSKESLYKTSAPDEKYGIKRETLDLSVNNIFEVETRNQETQTTLRPKRVKHSSKKESHKLPPCPENPEMSLLKKKSFEGGLKSKPSGEVMKTVPEAFACSSFLSAHDIGVQTEMRNCLAKPNYFTKPSFPVNPQTFLLLHSESEEDTKAPCKYHHKPKSKRKSDRKRDPGPPRSHQTASNAQNKKEKSSSGSSSKEVLRERSRRHGETPPPKPRMAENKKDLKVALSPSTMKKESARQRAERKRYQEIKPRKSSKSSTLSEISKHLPPSWHTKGNTLFPAGTDDIDIEAYKHLEKAIERALIDLGRIPDSSSLQGRPSTAPVAAALTSKDSSRSFTNLIETPRNQAGSISEMLHNQEQILKMTPEQLEIVLKILQKVLSQNTRPPDNE